MTTQTIRSENDKQYKNHPKQRKALHLWLKQCAKVLADSGKTMQIILSEVPEVQPTGEMLKEQVYKPLLRVMEGLESTEDQGTVDVEKVRREMIVFFAEKHSVTLPPFPDRFNQYER